MQGDVLALPEARDAMKPNEWLQELRSVCSGIDDAWAIKGYALESFADIVWNATECFSFSDVGNLEVALALLQDPSVSAQQQLSSFSDLYLRLFDNGRFWVEVLNWYGSDINIHDHDFAGVQFQARGHALNVSYNLTIECEYQGLKIGHLDVGHAEIWEEGNRSIVAPGRHAAHNVCHLDSPTVSVLIRTHPQPHVGEQWNYFPPGVAGSYSIASASFRKKVKALRLLAKHDASAFVRATRRFYIDAMADEVLFALVKMTDIMFAPQYSHLLLEIAESYWPLGEEIVRAVSVHRAMEICKRLKDTISFSFEDRKCLAVLGASYDANSMNRIARCAFRNLLDFDAAIATVLRNANTDLQDRLLGVLEQYGYDSTRSSSSV